MNVEKLKLLREKIAGLPEERTDLAFYMREKPCGTVCCIAGWAACMQLGDPKKLPELIGDIERLAEKFLAVDELENDSTMFFSSAYTLWNGKQEALSRIDFAIEHDGIFDWDKWMQSLETKDKLFA